MKIKLKRYICFLLAILIAVSNLALPVFADDDDEPQYSEAAQAFFEDLKKFWGGSLGSKNPPSGYENVISQILAAGKRQFNVKVRGMNEGYVDLDGDSSAGLKGYVLCSQHYHINNYTYYVFDCFITDDDYFNITQSGNYRTVHLNSGKSICYCAIQYYKYDDGTIKFGDPFNVIKYTNDWNLVGTGTTSDTTIGIYYRDIPIKFNGEALLEDNDEDDYFDINYEISGTDDFICEVKAKKGGTYKVTFGLYNQYALTGYTEEYTLDENEGVTLNRISQDRLDRGFSSHSSDSISHGGSSGSIDGSFGKFEEDAGFDWRPGLRDFEKTASENWGTWVSEDYVKSREYKPGSLITDEQSDGMSEAIHNIFSLAKQETNFVPDGQCLIRYTVPGGTLTKDSPVISSFSIQDFYNKCHNMSNYTDNVYFFVFISSDDSTVKSTYYSQFNVKSVLSLTDSLYSTKEDYLPLPSLVDNLDDWPELEEDWNIQDLIKWLGDCLWTILSNFFNFFSWLGRCFRNLISDIGIIVYNLVVDIKNLLIELFIPDSTEIYGLFTDRFPVIEQIKSAVGNSDETVSGISSTSETASRDFTIHDGTREYSSHYGSVSEPFELSFSSSEDVELFSFSFSDIPPRLKTWLYNGSTVVMYAVQGFLVLKYFFKFFKVSRGFGEYE